MQSIRRGGCAPHRAWPTRAASAPRDLCREFMDGLSAGIIRQRAREIHLGHWSKKSSASASRIDREASAYRPVRIAAILDPGTDRRARYCRLSRPVRIADIIAADQGIYRPPIVRPLSKFPGQRLIGCSNSRTNRPYRSPNLATPAAVALALGGRYISWAAALTSNSHQVTRRKCQLLLTQPKLLILDEIG